ncbi:MAG TPA: MFS transporter [Anaerolineae bacterium]|nr:MFS transporter [Anaerolineae bacterium]HQH39033.1 MFS transporter [Anaerolineae bacterium]
MKPNGASGWHALTAKVRRLDIFAIDGAPRRCHQGMKMFWWDGLLATISAAFVDTYVSLYALALGATNTHIGVLASASSFLGALTPLPGAALVQKLGHRKPLIVWVSTFVRTLILLAALVPLFFSGDTAVYIVIALFALRAGLNNLVHPAWVSMTGDVVPLEHRGRYFSMRNMAMALASMLFVPLAGQLIDGVGGLAGYQISLALAFVIGLTSSYAYSRIPEQKLVVDPQTQRISFWQALRTDHTFLAFTLIMMLWTFGVQVAGTYFTVYQKDVLQFSTRLIGLLATVTSVTSLIGQRVWGRLIDQHGSRWVMTLCALIIPNMPFVWMFAVKPWHVVFISLQSGFLWAGFNVASFNLLLELPDQKLRTQAAASYTTLVNIASIVAPLVGSLVIDRLGYRWDFGLSAVLRLLGAIAFLILLKPFGRGKRRAAVNGESANGESVNGESVNQESANGESVNGESVNQESKSVVSQTNDYQTKDYQTNGYQTNDYQTNDYQTKDYKTMTTIWKLNEQQYFEAPGLTATVFHDFYPEGKQGGLTLIQHGERVAACGDVRLEPTPGQWRPLPKVGERQVEGESLVVPAQFEEAGLRYTVRIRPEGESLRVAVDLAEPLPPEWEGKVGFNLELYPGALFGKTFHLGTTARVFPQQANGPRRRIGACPCCPVPLADGPTLTVAPEDPLRRLVVESLSGDLYLYDGRDTDANGWFVIREVICPGVAGTALQWRITPHSVPEWRSTPVICVSQVGYHPDQVKQAILELDPRIATLAAAVLQRLDAAGFTTVYAATPVRWGRWLSHDYAIFDFSAVREPGMYVVGYGGQSSPPFAIHPEVYRHGVWQPTLETYFPVQMCHVEVRDGARVWHGACHLDDALQAPAPHVHFDGYRQYDATETSYAPGEHIPHLDVGGWHDAGDYDLAAGSQARTTHTLCLIRELFGVATDQTTVKQDERLVLLHTPDGVPDLVEQVAHGALNLLSGYRATADMEHPHSFHGIIEATLTQYVHLGDAATMTDNHIYVPTLAAGQVRSDEAGHLYAGKNDDRWAFTNHDTALEYLVAAALAASSRVLRGYDDVLAAECLRTARRVWDYEHTHAPVEQRAAYVPRDVETQEIVAAVELLLTTGEERYRTSLLEKQTALEKMARWVGGAVARALPAIDDEAFTAAFRAAVKAGHAEFAAELASNPFGVQWRPYIWGVGWQIQQYAVEMYQIWQVFPDLVDREVILRVVNYVLGCHPASNTSLVSGVGAHSLTTAYGANRAEGSYIPGGMVSGVALIRPDFPELKEPWPFLWQQTEYVMPGAANYIFCVLAADRMLNREA